MISRLKNDERGVSAVVVVVCLIGLMGAAMLSIDAGNLWQSRRSVITATDSSALQEARTAIVSGWSSACTGTTWQNQLKDNSGADTIPLECDIVQGSPGTGYLKVAARKPVSVRFGGVLGIGDTSALSESYVQVGYLSSAQGLRPMAFCNKNSHIVEWITLQTILNNPPTSDDATAQALYDAKKGAGDDNLDGRIDHPVYTTGGVVHRMYFTKDLDDAACGDAPGQWGWFDMGGANNSNDVLRDLIEDGYPEDIGIGDCNADGTGGDACDGDPGSSGGSVASELQQLINDETIFAIPIFDAATLQGAGADFGVFGFLGVKLRDFKITGQEAARYFDFEFVNVVLEGKCCKSTGANTGPKGMKICSVDHDPQTVASRCAL